MPGRIESILWIGALVVLLPALASAQADDAQKPLQHEGFYLRAVVGPSYSHAWESYQGVDYTFDGVSLMLDFAVGGAVLPNFVINADLFGSYLFNPTANIDGAQVGESEATLSAFGLALGVTYFIMPLDIYLAASGGVARIGVESDGVSVNTDLGWGVNVLAGKQWRLGERSYLGLAAQFHFFSAPEQYIDANFNLMSGGLGISYSYN